MKLPDGMQAVNFQSCSGLAGKARFPELCLVKDTSPSFLTVSFFLFFTPPLPQVISAHSSSPQVASRGIVMWSPMSGIGSRV